MFGTPQSLAGWVLAAVLGLSKPEAGKDLSRPDLAVDWTTVDFRTATCGYVASTGLTFSLPPGYVVRDPNHGPEAGCFWGRQEDLDRAFVSTRRLNFERLGHGIFQAPMTPHVTYDGARP